MSLHATTPSPVDDEKKWEPLETRLREYSQKTCDSARGGFKYPGSVHVFRAARVGDYTQVGITDPGIVGRLIDNDILPSVSIGSRSQGEHEYSTEFCLDEYVKVGVTSPDDMLRLRDANVTAFGLYGVVQGLKAAGIEYTIGDLVTQAVRIATEAGVVRSKATATNQMVHEFNHGTLGTQFQEWLAKGNKP